MSGFIDDEELIGRTIAKVVVDADRVSISFTDGTWTSLVPVYYDEDLTFEEPMYAYKSLGLPEVSS